MSATTTRTQRACDGCRQRKTKCRREGTNPCKNCLLADLTCTYNAIPQKRGPKFNPAKVFPKLSKTDPNPQLADLLLPTIARAQGLVPAGLIESCLDVFFTNVYPLTPVLHEQRAQEAAVNMERCTESYCMILALCAYVMIQANMKVPSNILARRELAQRSNMTLGHALLEESVRKRNGTDFRENPTHMAVLTSWFYYGCYFGLDWKRTAWVYLREATTQAQLIGMHAEETYKHDQLDISGKRVLYWVLFMAERTYALQKHRPISLYATIHSPSLDEVPSDRPIAIGLQHQITLFKTIDDTFVNLWNRVHTHANPAWFAQLQTQLSEAVPTYLECTEPQVVDIRITQQWLKAMTWQLCVSQGLVSSMSNDSCMTFKYPIEISRDLLTMTHSFGQQALEVHGAGLIEKLFDIACCLADVVAVTSLSLDPTARDHVFRFLTLISTLRGGRSRYLPLLNAKLSEVLPTLQLPSSLDLPQALPASWTDMSGTGPETVL